MSLLPYGGKITHGEDIKILLEQEGLVIRENPINKFAVATLHHTADPSKRDPEWRAEAKARSLSEAKFRQEYDMDYTAMFGEKVFPQIDGYTDQIIIQAPYPVIDDSKLFAGFDWGIRNPSSVIVFAQTRNEMGHTCYDAIWEYYDVPSDLVEFSDTIRSSPYYNHIQYMASDPSIWQARTVGAGGTFLPLSVHMMQYGLDKIVEAPNREADWLTLMKHYWSNFEERGPLFRIWNTCPNLIREMRGAVFSELSVKQMQTKNQAEKMVDKDNHAMDAAKYFMLLAPPLVDIATLTDTSEEVEAYVKKKRLPPWAKYVRKHDLTKVNRRRIL